MRTNTARNIPVFSSRGGVGGVEATAAHVHTALVTGGYPSGLYEGLPQILRSPRPDGGWFSATWKVHAAVTGRHPGMGHGGYIWTHGAELTRDSGTAGRRLLYRSLDQAERLLAVSPLSCNLVPSRFHRKLLLVGPPIPRSPGDDLCTHKPLDDDVHLLSIGRAIPRKGHDTAIAVARALSRRVPVVLRIVGPGPDLPRLRSLAADPPAGLRIDVLGEVAEDAKERLFQISDVLLFLPRTEGTEFEGLGLVVLEAAARGCPAVVLDCGGSRYSVGPGRTGHVLPANAPAEAIAEAVYDVASEPIFRRGAWSYARQFDLVGWQRRIRAVLEGTGVGWEWPGCPVN